MSCALRYGLRYYVANLLPTYYCINLIITVPVEGYYKCMSCAPRYGLLYYATNLLPTYYCINLTITIPVEGY